MRGTRKKLPLGCKIVLRRTTFSVFDQPLASTGFAQWSDRWLGQPDNAGAGRDCGAFVKNGTIDGAPRGGTLPFSSERPLRTQLFIFSLVVAIDGF